MSIVDYTSYSNDEYNPSVEEVHVDDVVEETTDDIVMGKIAHADKVYVRSEPEVHEGNDIKILDKDTEVLVSEIMDDWCKICTESGLEGYVMKKFVDIS